MKNLRVSSLTIMTLALLHQSTFAELIAYEGFDFTGPEILGQGSGFGWNENEEDAAVGWINSNMDFVFVTNDGESLDSPAFPFTPLGNRVQAPSTPRLGPAVAARELRMEDRVDMSVDGGEIYMSFLIKKDGDGGSSSDNLELGLYSGGTPIGRFGSTSDDRFFITMTSSAAAGQISDDTIVFGETYFVVMKALSLAAEPDQLFAQVYDSSMSVPTSEPSEWDFSVSNSTDVSISRVRMAAGLNAWGAIDEIRVGSTFASVVESAVAIPGDFNEDTFVDSQDLAIWETSFGIDAGGDANGDGTTDGSDFLIWQRNYSPSATTVAVPEPNAVVLALMGWACFALRRNRVQYVGQHTE